jgi:hypothetical protein
VGASMRTVLVRCTRGFIGLLGGFSHDIWPGIEGTVFDASSVYLSTAWVCRYSFSGYHSSPFIFM